MNTHNRDLLNQLNEILPSGEYVILYDGTCMLCNGFVQWIIHRDKEGFFKFGMLQSETGQLVQQLVPDTDSVLLYKSGSLMTKSTAALTILSKLTWYKWMAIGKILPLGLRDSIYDWVARNRYRWFGRHKTCILPDEPLRKRMIDIDIK